MAKRLSWIRFAKYNLFRFLPGRIGLHYQRQFRRTKWRKTETEFNAALEASRGKSAIDLGANIGEFTCRLAEVANKVYSFEPDPWAFQQLRERTKHLNNVILFQAAVGSGSGRVFLYQHPKYLENRMLSSVSSIVHDSRVVRDQSEVVEVDKIDFLSFLSENDENFGLLKIDVEGAEVEILEALLASDQLQRFDNIFCETHEPELPHILARFKALRARAASLQHPRINLDWH